MTSKPEIILASTSPRRRELLGLIGWDFSTCSSTVAETARPGEEPKQLALRLARSKAEAARENCPHASLIIAADTLVIHGGQELGKPKDGEEAGDMLRGLRGREHEVITAVAIQTRGRALIIDKCESSVPMREYSDEEIQSYVEGGSPLDKAGAYGIQDPDFHPVEIARFRGCFANVMGLPLCHMVRALRGLGYAPPDDMPDRCMQFTGYDCTIYPTILGSDL